MLSNFFTKQKLKVLAPLSGEVVSLEEVPDPIFSEKMMGEGIAIMPTEGNIYSPFEGIVIFVAESKHAIGLRSKDGVEVLIHIGLETVSLKGKGFNLHVNVGEAISPKQLLMEVDWPYLKEHVPSIVTPMVITNSAEMDIQLVKTNNCTFGETVLMNISPKKFFK